ncbi:MAG: EscU/YscU/HrcU family type III secretion system export apparatus switch protein [Deltaproteobacteria bacterium]
MDKKKIKEAAVLKYSAENEEAPKIVALGKGDIAEKILEIAKENSVPIYENPELAHTLNAMNIGEEIPPELYEIVAQILVFVSDLDNLHSKTK